METTQTMFSFVMNNLNNAAGIESDFSMKYIDYLWGHWTAREAEP